MSEPMAKGLICSPWIDSEALEEKNWSGFVYMLVYCPSENAQESAFVLFSYLLY